MSRKEVKQDLVKVVGSRLREARELNNMSLSVAAKRLGYQSGSKLSKIELASDTTSVPFDRVVDAAKLYMVSLDWLSGLTDDWDETVATASERMAACWLLESLEKSRARDLAVIKEAMTQFRLLNEAMLILNGSADKAIQAFQSFSEKNEGFEDMPASNRLLSGINGLKNACMIANGNMNRIKSKTELSLSPELQMGLFNE